MYELRSLLIILLLGPLLPVVAVICAARVWRNHERSILAASCVVSVSLLAAGAVGAFVLFATGGSDITVTVANSSAWPIDVSATNVRHTVIEPGKTQVFHQWADLGFSGLIDDLEIFGGSDGKTRIHVEGITSEENPTIRISGPLP